MPQLMLGRCNPAKVAPLQDVCFLNANMTGMENFLGVDLGVVATLKVSLFNSSATVKWQYEAEQDSSGVYRIKNIQVRQLQDNSSETVISYLQIASSNLSDVKVGGFPADKRFANWRPVLNKSGNWVFENVMKPGFYLYLENGAIKVGSLSSPALSQDLKYQWLPCT